ncbi:hypothetical protein EG328_001017 [Venturia inaequalis]|uniref:GAF domain-containing protein n=1 Tax=Venturia inaequalis TaxID=5025 RepID=A0A8H3YIU4_VENIN|nr:hypothetical protein EG328_001017 [Venturia inaequalis]KAE9974825.1 hypothetical protein EG327_008648 [Venturia inaequalis]
MVHADASTFVQGLSKSEAYEQVIEGAKSLFEGQRNWVWYALQPNMCKGHVACQLISFGKGVCGTAAEKKKTQLVRDVDQFPGHIACDGSSRSEIVVPIIQNEKVVAIIDVDCAELHGFDEVDQKYLEELADILADTCDF